MYVVVRRYSNATDLFDTMTQRKDEVERLISGVPGFIAYYAVRSGDEGATVTVCESQAGTQESSRVAADWVRQNVPSVSPTPLSVTEGETFVQFGR
jgi:heme-degrading monooxygenase HmoA